MNVDDYDNYEGGTCNYELRLKLVAFLVSLFVGGLGADWFYLARGCHGGYVCAGVAKLLTCGGCCIWWLADWIRILTNDFKDSNGMRLADW